MINQKLLQCLLCVMLITLLQGMHNRLYAIPRGGDWKVPTDFGEMVLTVNSEGTKISKVTITFSSYKCGGITQSGTIMITPGLGYPITNNQFTFELSISVSIKLTINGTFTQSGDQASGTWSLNCYGTICSGNWNHNYTSVEELVTEIPERLVIEQNYPNPFNSSTTIQFALPRTSYVSIKVYNILGSEVGTLVDKHLLKGKHETKWNASDVASGVYLYRVKAGDFVETRMMVVQK